MERRSKINRVQKKEAYITATGIHMEIVELKELSNMRYIIEVSPFTLSSHGKILLFSDYQLFSFQRTNPTQVIPSHIYVMDEFQLKTILV